MTRSLSRNSESNKMDEKKREVYGFFLPRSSGSHAIHRSNTYHVIHDIVGNISLDNMIGVEQYVAVSASS